MTDVNKEKRETGGFISLTDAAKLIGYTSEHLNLMARKGKLGAKKLGRNWCTSRQWLGEFLLSLGKDKKEIEKILGKDWKKVQRPKTRKFFPLALAATIALVVFIGVPLARYTFLKNNQLELEWREKVKSLSEGMIKGEETEAPLPESAKGVILASENYKAKQVRFGGSVAVLSDENLPLKITDMKGETFLDKKQEEAELVISWRTNKLAISEVEYYQNNGQNPKKENEKSFGFNHGIIIPGLEPATAYIYSIKSRDRWGNETTSDYYAVYTGSRMVSVFELIVKALEETFGWAVKK